jgi:hypothetical protein
MPTVTWCDKNALRRSIGELDAQSLRLFHRIRVRNLGTNLGNWLQRVLLYAFDYTAIFSTMEEWRRGSQDVAGCSCGSRGMLLCGQTGGQTIAKGPARTFTTTEH